MKEIYKDTVKALREKAAAHRKLATTPPPSLRDRKQRHIFGHPPEKFPSISKEDWALQNETVAKELESQADKFEMIPVE